MIFLSLLAVKLVPFYVIFCFFIFFGDELHGRRSLQEEPPGFFGFGFKKALTEEPQGNRVPGISWRIPFKVFLGSPSYFFY